MDRLFFSCPTTGRKVDAGIEAELETVLLIRGQNVSAACPHCGQRHDWLVRDAYLGKAPADVASAA